MLFGAAIGVVMGLFVGLSVAAAYTTGTPHRKCLLCRVCNLPSNTPHPIHGRPCVTNAIAIARLSPSLPRYANATPPTHLQSQATSRCRDGRRPFSAVRRRSFTSVSPLVASWRFSRIWTGTGFPSFPFPTPLTTKTNRNGISLLPLPHSPWQRKQTGTGFPSFPFLSHTPSWQRNQGCMHAFFLPLTS